MSDDEFLAALARAAREEGEEEAGRLDDRWDRLAAGQLSAKEELELRRLASASEEAGRVYEAFRPLGAEFEARVVAAIRAQPGEEGREERSGVPPAVPFTPARGRLLSRPPLAPRRQAGRAGRSSLTRWLGGGGFAAAAAAGLLLWLRLPGPLPGYGLLEVVAGDQQLRGGEELTPPTPSGPHAPPSPKVAVLHQGSSLEAAIQPLARLEGPIEVRWFLVGDPGVDPRVVEIKPAGRDQAWVTPEGAAELQGTVGTGPGDLRLPSGRRRLWVVIGRPGRLPPPEALRSLRAAQRASGGEWIAKPGWELQVDLKP